MKSKRESPRLRMLLLGTCLLWSSAAHSQSARRLEGRILDQSGGWIWGATVTLYSDDRVRTTIAGWEGEFAFAGLTAPVHYIEASSKGFFSASTSVTTQTTGSVTINLRVGEGGQCLDTRFTDPMATYEVRSGKVQLSGRVVDFSGLALPNASLNLMQADLNTPEAGSPDPHPNAPMNRRVFPYTSVTQMIANEKGEFQFSGLEPGWYSLIVAHEGYQEGTAKFWIARESLTRTTLIHLNLRANATGCDTIFGPVYLFPTTFPSTSK